MPRCPTCHEPIQHEIDARLTDITMSRFKVETSSCKCGDFVEFSMKDRDDRDVVFYPEIR